jgi:hypothetical protein
MSMVTPMTATQEEKEPGAIEVGLSHEEAEMLRALLRRNEVAEMDALARLRTGRLIAEATYQPPKRGGAETTDREGCGLAPAS